jgi:hypothetical protein
VNSKNGKGVLVQRRVARLARKLGLEEACAGPTTFAWTEVMRFECTNVNGSRLRPVAAGRRCPSRGSCALTIWLQTDDHAASRAQVERKRRVADLQKRATPRGAGSGWASACDRPGTRRAVPVSRPVCHERVPTGQHKVSHAANVPVVHNAACGARGIARDRPRWECDTAGSNAAEIRCTK